MKIQCPACNAEYEVETSLIGKHVECVCGNKFDISDNGVKRKHFKSLLAGQNYYLPAMNRFLSSREPKIIIEFNPQNEYDPYAIQVLNAGNRELLGHVERGIAAQISLIVGEPVKFEGKIVPGRYGYNVDFFYFYLPPTTQEKKDLQKQIEKKRICAIQFLQEYVSAIQSEHYNGVAGCDQIMQAQEALYALDPQNPIIQDFAKLKNSIIECDLQDARIQYVPKAKPMFEFPGIDNVKEDCRFFGKCVLFTGFYPEEKAQIALIVDFLRINQPSKVCQKLDFLICGSNAGPAKIKKAEEMGKTIIQAADFIQEITGHAPRKPESDDFQIELL